MKKSILIAISLVAVFFFAGITQVSAQCTFEVKWFDAECNCNIITSKTIEWEIRKAGNNQLICSGTEYVTSNTTNSEIITCYGTINTDTFYNVCAKVSYYDGSAIDPLCCSGDKCENGVDGQVLIDDEVVVIVDNMQ